MKTKNGLVAVILLLNIISISAQNLFSKLSDNEDVTLIHISKAMLNAFPSLSDKIQIEGVNMRIIIQKLEQIDIYTSEIKEASQLIRVEAKKLQSQSKSYESLMRIKNKEDDLFFYAEKDEDKYKSLVLFVDGAEKCTLIRLLGSFTAEDIQDITKK
jgi:hypothetical protein